MSGLLESSSFSVFLSFLLVLWALRDGWEKFAKRLRPRIVFIELYSLVQKEEIERK